MKSRVLTILTISFIATLLFATPAHAGGLEDGYVDQLFADSAAMARTISGGIGIMFGIGLVVSLARAQLAGATGDTLGYSRSLQQGLAMVILLAMAANSEMIAGGLRAIGIAAAGETGAGTSGAWLISTWQHLAKFIVGSILGCVGVFTTLAIIWSGVGVQAMTFIGAPGGISAMLLKGGILLLGGIATFFMVTLANGLIDLFFT